VVGEEVGGLAVRSLEELHRVTHEEKISIAIVAVPVSQTQEVVDQLVACGVRAILNYAPISPHVREGVRIRNIDPVLSLQSMTYYINEEGES
jgi:redox-sensing transcriptional repressor